MTFPEEARHHALRARLSGLPESEYRAPTHHHTVLRGMRFHHLEWGEANRPAVLFLHGGGQTARTWDIVCHELSRRYRCLALDQRGHGDSEWSNELDYRTESHVADIEAFVDGLHGGPKLGRFVLVGMSMGGLNALHYATQHPDRLAALVCVDCGPWVRLEGGARIAEFVRRAAELDSLEAYVDAAIRFNPRRDPRLLRVSLLHNLRQMEDGRWTWKTDLRKGFDLGRIESQLEALRGRLDRVTCPTLILRGAESEVFLDEDADRFSAALPRGSWARVPDSGHTIQGDNPRALLEHLERFLAETMFV